MAKQRGQGVQRRRELPAPGWDGHTADAAHSRRFKQTYNCCEMTRTAGLRKLASPVRANKTVAWAGWLAALIACVLANLEGGRIGVAAGSFLVALVGLPAMLRLRRDHLDAVGLYALMAVLSFGLLSLLWLVTPAVPAPGVDS